MNVEECKSLICQIMKNLISKVSDDDLKELGTEETLRLSDVLDEKMWKESSKRTSSKDGVTRVFSNISIDAKITLQEIPNADGNSHVEVNMTKIPNILQRAVDAVDQMDLPGSGNVGPSVARRTEEIPSMKEGPKPEGFGMFS